jgi:hypothetical protein
MLIFKNSLAMGIKFVFVVKKLPDAFWLGRTCHCVPWLK